MSRSADRCTNTSSSATSQRDVDACTRCNRHRNRSRLTTAMRMTADERIANNMISTGWVREWHLCEIGEQDEVASACLPVMSISASPWRAIDILVVEFPVVVLYTWPALWNWFDIIVGYHEGWSCMSNEDVLQKITLVLERVSRACFFPEVEYIGSQFLTTLIRAIHVLSSGQLSGLACVAFIINNARSSNCPTGGLPD